MSATSAISPSRAADTTPGKTHARSSIALWLSILAAFLSAIIVSCLVSAWVVWHVMSDGTRFTESQSSFILKVAQFVPLLRQAYSQVTTGTTPGMLLSRSKVEKPYWQRNFPAATDAGYLLLSAIAPDANAPVKLLRIADGKIMAQWLPDWEAVNRGIKLADRRDSAHHPLLLDDGDIIFNTPKRLVRQSPCSSQPVWVLGESFHHSIDLDSEGTLWVPTVVREEFADNPWLQQHLREDALARVSLDGKILERRSFARILRENQLQWLLFAANGAQFQRDPIHLNQIKAAPSDGPHWQRGDLLLSTRHMSTVFLYRPSTGRILWYQQGPWLNQHSVDFVDDHRISVFDNHVVHNIPSRAFADPQDFNHLVVYDFQTRSTSEPFATLLALTRPATVSEGRGRILPDGGLFIEETNYGRHLRFSQTELLWSRVNDYDDKRIGMVFWSRYLTAQEAAAPLAALAARRCAAG